MNRYERILLVVVGVIALGLGAWLTFAQSTLNTGNGITEGLNTGDVPFTFQYPQPWQQESIEQLEGKGIALTYNINDEFGLSNPTAILTMVLVETDRAEDVFDDLSQGCSVLVSIEISGHLWEGNVF